MANSPRQTWLMVVALALAAGSGVRAGEENYPPVAAASEAVILSQLHDLESSDEVSVTGVVWVIDCLGRESAAVKEAARRALQAHRSQAASVACDALLGSSSDRRRLLAARALGVIGISAILPRSALIRASSDNSPSVASAASTALEMLGPPSADEVTGLTRLLKETTPEVQAAAVDEIVRAVRNGVNLRSHVEAIALIARTPSSVPAAISLLDLARVLCERGDAEAGRQIVGALGGSPDDATLAVSIGGN